ncbi:MAG: RHS repeat-associated core domain-containing protein [Chloroflexi bacterium]|nr:RHS repeat-associated core domain-containing protein [Chloroflexota bacterium]
MTGLAHNANGNMTTRVEGGSTYTQNFDAENRLTSVTVGGQTTTFVYDGDGNLIKKVNPNGTYTVYVGGLYEVEYSAANVATKKTSYYPAGAYRLEIVGTSNNVYYMVGDHLGSASVRLTSSGNIGTGGEQRYYPFGESRITNADLKTDHLFTGQLSVGLGGIYSYGARFYSSKLGRFLSADTVVPDWKYPQSLNRYSYVYNNPLKYVDPTGHRTECSGTSDFISESTGDGGISWASCWAIQRDKGLLTSIGVSDADAETIATGVDKLGLQGGFLVFYNQYLRHYDGTKEG